MKKSHLRRVCMVLLAVVGILSGCSKSTQPQNPPPADNLNDPIPALGGYVDQVHCDAVTGWAWNKVQPNSTVEIDIYDGENRLVTIPASDLRDDLVKADLGNGRHAFTYSVPPSLRDGKAHTIHVRVSSGGPELRLSPQTLNCK